MLVEVSWAAGKERAKVHPFFLPFDQRQRRFWPHVPARVAAVGSPSHFLRGSISSSWCRVIILWPLAHELYHEKRRGEPAPACPHSFEFDEKKEKTSGPRRRQTVFNALASFFDGRCLAACRPDFFLLPTIALQLLFSIHRLGRGRKRTKASAFLRCRIVTFLMGSLSSPLAASTLFFLSLDRRGVDSIRILRQPSFDHAPLSPSLFSSQTHAFTPLNDLILHFLS